MPRDLNDFFRASFPQGPVNHASLAETATSRASAKNLDGDPVMDDAGIGNNKGSRRKRGIHVSNKLSLDRENLF
jgi:hypothetical protein